MELWKRSKEVRAFVEGSHFINLKVTELILGEKMDTRTQGFIKKLVFKIDPTIEIRMSNI